MSLVDLNKLTLNFYSIHFTAFANNKSCVNRNVGYEDKRTEEVETTKFLGLQIDSNLNWITHIKYIIPKLSSARFDMRTVATYENRNFKISLLCLLSFHCHMASFFGGEIQWTVKKYFTSK
jgi:hypothetical protein